jgi:hypothetical protein
MRPEKTNPLRDECLAAESQQGADDALALPSRLERYSIAHRRALHMSDYAASQNELKTARHLKECGHWLLFKDYFTVGKVKLSKANFCNKHLLCPLCAIRRGAKYLQAYHQRLQVIQQEHPTIKAYMVTVTVKDGADLKERFQHLRTAMRSMTQARRDHLKAPSKNRHVEAAKALGGVHSIEFKRGKNSGLWHPHAHMVWLCYEQPDAAKLSQEWKHWTGDSFIVDVRPFHNQKDVIRGFLEVFKYALKFSDMSLPDNWEAAHALQSRRLVDNFGLFRGVKVPESMTDEGLDDLPYIELIYEFTRAGYSLRYRDKMDVVTGEVDLDGHPLEGYRSALVSVSKEETRKFYYQELTNHVNAHLKRIRFSRS